MSIRLWKVAVDAPMSEALTYSAPEEMGLARGQVVQVPLGKRRTQGLVLGPAQETTSEFTIKSVDHPIEEYPRLPESYLKWLEWLSKYYLYPPGLTAFSTWPPLSKQIKERKSKRSPVIPEMPLSKPPELTEEQKKCLDGISVSSGFQAHLVFGVTGSGKTEIYLQLLERVLAEGKSGLVLVPEISLTPQLVQRFTARFGDSIAALHSQLTDRERTNQWWDMIEGRKKILIGARSALFCPLENLGLIVVDEEHEPSFKQDEKLKYHGRDAAVMMAHLNNCPVVLGSATPSLESWQNALDGKYKLHRLQKRVAGRELPHIEIVDLRIKPEPSRQIPVQLPYWLSPSLYLQMQQTLERNEQVALFLNRRGMAHLVVCPACGHTRECPNCDINLTLHAGNHLICHYCDYHENLREKCLDCREGQMEKIGLGTELIEKDLAPLFPGRRIARADRDEIQNRLELEEMIRQMEVGEIDILVGTQMIAKGLDFPQLKLVGLILADVGFNLPDFRATERSFQLMTQMAGRSGRHVKPGESPGQVIIQTFNTEHDSLRFTLQHDFEAFAAHEIEFRKALNYPPAGRLISFRVQAADLKKGQETSRLLAARARALQERHEPYKSLEILGPAEAPLARIRNQYRFQVLMKASRADILNSFARQLLGDEKWVPAGVRLIADVDPLHLL